MKNIKNLLTIEHLADGAMIVFALASVGNIAEYMRVAGHNHITAYGQAVALGLGLVVFSVLLARVSPSDKGTFWFMLLATTALGLLSGAVQSKAYLRYTPTDPVAAYLFGFGFPVVGECLLALAMSVYTEGQKRKRLNASDDAMNEKINTFIDGSLDNVDLTKMAAHIERQVFAIVRNRIDTIAKQRLSVGQSDKNTGQLSDIIPPEDVRNGEIGQGDERKAANLDKANEQRQEKSDKRRRTILGILSEYMSVGVGELHDLLGGKEFCSRSTLNDDLSTLAGQGAVYNQDRKWHYVPPLGNIPTEPVVVLNGNRGN
jgi:hypothetical protein